MVFDWYCGGMEQDRTVISRRNRPAKAPLTREGIVAKGLEILASEGLAGLSLRRVATALDTGPASLYVYLPNLGALHAEMLDAALAAVAVPEAGPWRERLKAVLWRYLTVLTERPGLAQLALGTIASGANSLRVWEMLLGLLQEGGVDDKTAVWGVDLLILYVTAIAAEQSLRSGDDLARVEAALASISPVAYPLVCAARATLLAGGEERGLWALNVIIDGLVGPPDPGRTA